MMESSSLTEDDLPAVVMPGAALKQATPDEPLQPRTGGDLPGLN